MVHGKKGFERIVWAFKNVLNSSVTWLFYDFGTTQDDPANMTRKARLVRWKEQPKASAYLRLQQELRPLLNTILSQPRVNQQLLARFPSTYLTC